MLTLLILAPIFLVLLIVSLIVRLIVAPFRLLGHRHHRFGHHPRHGGFGGLGSILLLVALDRLFGRRF